MSEPGDIIKSFVDENKVICGICDARPLEGVVGLCDIPFFQGTAEDRLDPALLLPSAQSVIVIGVAYYRLPDFPDDGLPRGRFSMSAVGEDYHFKVRGLLERLAGRLAESAVFDCYIHVDTGPLYERGFAQKAGLGATGRNGNIISRELGSLFNIGLLLTSLPLMPTPPRSFDPCGECRRCLDACPSVALAGAFHYRRCIAYLTQKKGGLEPWEHELIKTGGSLYGCDLCQNVCPHNAELPVLPAGDISIDEARPRLDDFDSFSPGEFRERYGRTAAGWRGLKVIKRNANIIRRLPQE